MQRAFDIQAFLKAALHEDIGQGDITSNAVISQSARGKYVFRARESMIVAGAIYIPMLFKHISEDIHVMIHADDGQEIAAGGVIAEVAGSARGILAGERVALNILQHLSAIATNTHAYVQAIKGTSAQIIDTRKTLPGWRELQKYAVRCGGGHNHRMGLYDGVLIKDNHIAIAGSVAKAVKAAKQAAPNNMKIEVECDTYTQVEEAIGAGADIILLDNMDIATLSKSVAVANAKGIITEASGNVTLETVRAIAQTGVDRISIGRLTHSVKAVDIGLDAA